MISSLVKLLTRFRAARAGNLAIITALSIAPLMVAAGGITDISLLLSTRDVAQAALDAATLDASGSALTDESQLNSLTSNVFHAMVQSSMASNAVVKSVSYDAGTHTIVATATGTYQAKFGQLVGLSSVPYTVTSTTVRAADGTLEVALVLDNTWSMSVALDSTGTKIAVLKNAAKNLINQIMTSQNSGNVKVAVVPYADYVNVGTVNRTSGWVSVGADYSQPVAQVCKTSTTQWVCHGGYTSTCSSTTDGVTSTNSCTVGQTCGNVTVAPYQSCSGGYTNYYKWFGCVGNLVKSVSGGLATIALPDPSLSYPGYLTTNQACLNAIQPLTTDGSKALSSVAGLVVNIGGYKPETYIPSGLIWGVNTLSPAAPFTEGAAYDPHNKQPRKAIILMTDGSNTEYLKADGTVGMGNATQVAQTYKDQQAICDYAKSKNIEIYTIGFGVSDQTSLKALQTCATDSGHYFDAKSSGGLLDAFKTIAGSLSNVRISG